MSAVADTIAAVATPPGQGGIGVIRVSGPATLGIAVHLLGHEPRPRFAHLTTFRDAQGAAIDQGLLLYFPAPQSFTGESVVELHGHGGSVVMDGLLTRVLELGARPARPGEFTERAFLNDKMDLAQAEAVADLITAASAQAARGAMRSLEGTLSRHIQALVDQLVALRAYVEATIDFPEDEVDFLGDGYVEARLKALLVTLDDLLANAEQGRLLREGMTVVIAGRPNAGKSSLLNQLAAREAAIVTDIPGTTRDPLRESIAIDGLPLHVIDTAGLREGNDPVEQAGVERAWAAIQEADRVLLVVDDQIGVTDQDRAVTARLPADLPQTIVFNKIDLTARNAGCQEDEDSAAVALSAHTGAGLEDLRQHLKQTMGYAGEAGMFMARRRHLAALGQAWRAVARAQDQLVARAAGELVAEELRDAQQALGEITGQFTTEDLLGEIFSRFCIGK